MIELIQLRNFRSWDRLDLELDLVTTLVGPNGSGKTNVIRALYWLCFGRPLGQNVVRNGASSCRVGIHTSDNRQLERRLHQGRAAYRLDGNKVLKAFGTEVPPEVQQLLNILPINIQRQLDAPFWMMESPGQAARNLNGIVNLDQIDMAMSQVGSRVKKTIATHQIVTQREETLSGEVDALSWVHQFDSDLSEIEQYEEELKHVEEELISLRMASDNVVRCEKKRDKLKIVTSHDGMMEKLDEISRLDEEIGMFEKELEWFQQDFKRTDELATEAIALSADLHSAEQEFRTQTKEQCPTCGTKLPSLSVSLTSTCQSGHPSPAPAKSRGKTR